MAVDVFLSVGRTFNAEQEGFVAAVEDFLRAHDMNPRTVGRNSFSSRQPLLTVNDLLQTCSGTIVVALERTHLLEALERRGSPSEVVIRDSSLPTVWNQLEAAMSYVHELPLLVLVQNGIRREGLLEKGYDWYVQRLDLDSAALHGVEFLGVFEDWRKRVVVRAAQGPSAPNHSFGGKDPSRLTLRELVGSLTVPQLWKMGAAITGLLFAIGGIAFRLGSGI